VAGGSDNGAVTLPRKILMVVAVTLLGLGVAVPANAAAAQRVCRVGDSRLTEISGMAATQDGYVVVNDGADDPAGRRIFFLNKRCKVVRTVAYPSRPRDTEDLALAGDGTVWVADIGDNGANRSTIALWRLAPGGRAPVIYRLTYPDGAQDAEALLLAPDGTPIIVTKSPLAAGAYVPAATLRPGGTTSLRRAGNVRLPLTDTSNPFSLGGRLVITGGAVSPDGTRAVLRTYADAFTFEVRDGDVLGAITGGDPASTPLPDEPQGESIAWSRDGTALLTVSEGARPEILRYPGVAAPAATAATPTTTTPTTAAPTTTAPTATDTAAGSATPAAAAAASSQTGGVPVGLLAAGAVLAAAAVGFLLVRRRRGR
jgi:hypothetical protein